MVVQNFKRNESTEQFVRNFLYDTIYTNKKIILFVTFINCKGAHSPDVRVLSMGVFPIQAIKSKVSDQDTVSSNDRILNILFHCSSGLMCLVSVSLLCNHGLTKSELLRFCFLFRTFLEWFYIKIFSFFDGRISAFLKRRKWITALYCSHTICSPIC